MKTEIVDAVDYSILVERVAKTDLTTSVMAVAKGPAVAAMASVPDMALALTTDCRAEIQRVIAAAVRVAVSRLITDMRAAADDLERRIKSLDLADIPVSAASWVPKRLLPGEVKP